MGIDIDKQGLGRLVNGKMEEFCDFVYFNFFCGARGTLKYAAR